MDAIEAVRRAARPDRESWSPELLDPARPGDRARIAELAASGAVEVCDEIGRQLRELVLERHPGPSPSAAEVDEEVARLLGGRAPEEHGTWVHYPWARRLVHVLPEPEFHWLRTRRNRYKLTEEEQERLRAARVGIVGMSVGRSAAVAMAMEGIGGELRIADPDVLDLTNLNRLAAGVADLGVNKTVLAARALAEIDPYLRVRAWPGGLTDDVLDEFLDGLDVVVEECDDIRMKLLVRKRARDRGIPVVMDTSDRGLLDVERFDLEPDRPLLHGLAGGLDPERLADLDMKTKTAVALRIVGGASVSARAAASAVEVDQTIRGWPQLAEDVVLGGAVAAGAVRRILLAEPLRSGRYYVDVDAALERPVLAEPVRALAGDEDRPSVELPPPVRGGPRLGADEVRALVGHAVLAPSAHNGQPWRFRFDGRDAIEVRADPTRRMEHLDFRDGAVYLALGAAVENLVLAAGAAGFVADVDEFPDPSDPLLAARVRLRFEPAAAARDPLAQHVGARCTNRRPGERGRPLADEEVARLSAAAAPFGKLVVLTSAGDLARLAPLVGESDRLTFLNEAIHREIMEGIRWTREEAERTRDGLDIATLEYDAAEREAARLLARWGAMRLLKRIGGGRLLTMGKRIVEASSGAVLVLAEGTGRESYFRGGRAMQRAWLAATGLGLAVQPLATLPYLFARLERGGGEGLDEGERATLRELRATWNELFRPPPGHAEVMLLRVARAGPPTARSLRRPVDEVLELGP